MSDPGSKTEGAREEAAAWFARLDTRAISTATLREFQAWRRDATNAAAFAEVEQVWRKTARLASDRHIQAAIAEALERDPEPRPIGDILEAPTPRDMGAMVAALALAVLLVAGLFRVQAGDTYATKVGEQRLVALADGSKVRLDTDTKLSARLSDKGRDLTLTHGRAFFDVAHDPARPFTVKAGGATVRALGTRFDVARDPKGVEVTLVTGRVEVRQGAGGEAWTLQPGQQLVVSARGEAAKPKAVDVAAETSWTAGRLDFRALPLAQAIAAVNRYSPHRIRLDAQGLGQTPVSGVFNTGDSDAFVAAVADLYGLKALRKSNGDVVLAARSDAPPRNSE